MRRKELFDDEMRGHVIQRGPNSWICHITEGVVKAGFVTARSREKLLKKFEKRKAAYDRRRRFEKESQETW